MSISPFHAYYTARKLESLSEQDKLLPVFASSDIKIYPFQIAAANFALHSPYQKGAILCDESGMGKSHEAMLVIIQKWHEGQNRILLAIPNADLLMQWVEMIEKHYTMPYLIVNREQITVNNENLFEQDGLVITTYDFLAHHHELATNISWDLCVFEEANALSLVYQDDSKQAKLLKQVAGESFKLLLTGTPIEKNIMDLYGLIYFIDETLLPGEQEFLQRYLRKPENYPELAERVSKYCFRTLRSQAKQYTKIPKRLLVTDEYTQSGKEQELSNLLTAYVNRENKLAFPDMNTYDLSLRLFDLQGSSTSAVLQTIQGVIRRLEQMPNAQDELAEFIHMEEVAKSIPIDSKTKRLLIALEKGFAALKKMNASKKALIFTHSRQTQKYLYDILSPKYKTVLYNGAEGYSAIKKFRSDAEILISTDNGARGFNLEQTAFVIHYDLLFNTLKMEQRIDRCHRLNQENDVISLAFIDKQNFADVRKLELMSKRTLVTGGVFGVSDAVVGGFTDNLEAAFEQIAKTARTKEQVQADYITTLAEHETDNKHIVCAAEDILFTTFTKEISDKIKITPDYIESRAEELNGALWSIVKWYFEKYNENNTDCYFAMDENAKTITARNYEKLPKLFYYWTGSGNRPYTSLKSYGMAKDFKPHYGRITFSSVIGRGIIHELECANFGKMELEAWNEQCQIALYDVQINAGKSRIKNMPILTGRTQIGDILTDDECQKIIQMSFVNCTSEGNTTPHWLKGTSEKPHEMDSFVPVDELIKSQSSNLSDAQAEEIERIKLRAASGKSAINHAIDDAKRQIKAMAQELHAQTHDRMKTLAIERKLNLLKQEFLKKQENQFFEAMQLDVEVEDRVSEFLGREKLTAKAVRQFVINVEGKR